MPIELELSVFLLLELAASAYQLNEAFGFLACTKIFDFLNPYHLNCSGIFVFVASSAIGEDPRSAADLTHFGLSSLFLAFRLCVSGCACVSVC